MTGLSPAELRARVLLAASQQDAAPRERVQRQNRWLYLSACAVPVLLFAAFGGVRAAPRPLSLVLQASLGAAAIALFCGVLGFSRGRSSVGRPRIWLLSMTALAAPSLLAWKVMSSSQFGDMMQRWPTRVGLRCFGLSCLMAVWPLVALLLARRYVVPVHPTLTGAATGAAIGAALWVLIDLNCPVAYVPHLLLGHVLPLLLITLAGAGLGRQLLALRGRQ